MNPIQISNTCPLCTKRFSIIQHGSRRVLVKKKIQKQEDHLNASVLRAIDNTDCNHCQSGDNPELLLLCDGCDAGYHTYCVGLDDIPQGDWFCETCNALNQSPEQRHSPQRRNGTRSRRRNRYDPSFISTNEHNPEMLLTQDADYRPSGSECESENDEFVPDDEGEEEEEEEDSYDEDFDLMSPVLSRRIKQRTTKRENQRKRKRETESEEKTEIKTRRSRKRKRFESDDDDEDYSSRALEGNMRSFKRIKTESTWNCKQCTLRNGSHLEKCEICDAPKPMTFASRRSELDCDDYFGGITTSRKGMEQKLKLESKQKAPTKKWSRSNPYRSPNWNRKQKRSHSLIDDVPHGILSKFDITSPSIELASTTSIASTNSTCSMRESGLEKECPRRKAHGVDAFDDIEEETDIDLDSFSRSNFRLSSKTTNTMHRNGSNASNISNLRRKKGNAKQEKKGYHSLDDDIESTDIDDLLPPKPRSKYSTKMKKLNLLSSPR